MSDSDMDTACFRRLQVLPMNPKASTGMGWTVDHTLTQRILWTREQRSAHRQVTR